MLKHKKILYVILTVVIIFAGACRNNITGFQIIEGKTKGNLEQQWDSVIASELNKKEITLVVDQKKINLKDKKIYFAENMEPMIPKSILTEAFSCAAHINQDQTLLIERNNTEITLKNELKKIDGEFYVPLEAIVEGFAYHMQWSRDDLQISMDSLYKRKDILPEKYDYREKGRVPEVRNQQQLGTCWAFASLTALESCLYPDETPVYSEDHMSIKNSFGLTQDDGGEYTMSMAYLLSWQGPVLEKDDTYGDGYSPDDLKPVKHIQGIKLLPAKDYEEIKKTIFLYGGVQSSLYTSLKNYKSRSIYYNQDNFSYCYIGSEQPNHDVVIVGWDDHYPKEKFNMDVEGDGAFICVNSWGQEFGDQGFFYVSYYDSNIGVSNIFYDDIEDTDNYDDIYQADLCGWSGQIGYGASDVYFANAYTATEDSTVMAAGFYATGDNTSYKVYIAEDITSPEDLNNRKLVATGTVKYAGYSTIKFDTPTEVKKNSKFAVIVYLDTPGKIHPAAIEYPSDDNRYKVDLTDGEGYISADGSKWEATEETYHCNICLKAYTNRKGTMKGR